MQDNWVTKALKPGTSWACHTLAAIYLRTTDGVQEPTEAEIECCIKKYEITPKLKGKKSELFDMVTQEQVRFAF